MKSSKPWILYKRVWIFQRTIGKRVRPYCPFSHRTHPPENITTLKDCSSLYIPTKSFTHTLSYIAAMTTQRTQISEINLQPSQAQDYSAYVPVRLGKLITTALIDSSNTFANVISPQMMTALGITLTQLEPIPQLSVGTAAAGKRMKILGQAPRIDLQIGQHLAKFRIRPLVLQGLVHLVNICGPFLARAGIDQIIRREFSK